MDRTNTNQNEALATAQRSHRPHSLLESQRHWQHLTTDNGVACWGYAYDGGHFERHPSPASPQWETATPGCTGPDY